MKFIWEREDIKPGTKVFVPGTIGLLMIGYDPTKPKTGKRYHLISLSDGMVEIAWEIEELVNGLNHEGVVPYIEGFNDDQARDD